MTRQLIVAALLSLCTTAIAEAGQIIDAGMHHLRWGDRREWSEFPEQSEGAELRVTFNAVANAAEKTLRIRHRDLKQQWRVLINGKAIAALPQDENEMVTYWAIPPRTLREGANELHVACGGGPADDVLIGDIELIDQPLAAVLSQASIDISVTDTDRHEALPCRITIADDRGALMSLGATSDAHQAVRPGVVYTADGKAHISLPAGRYTIYAGRGFAYGIDSAAVDLRPGDAAHKELHIRREVSLSGYLSCDTHIHTFTYSRHGDANITERMITLAGEDIQLPIATDHNIQIDYDKPARELGLRKFFTPVIGNEVTTDKLGHFCVFPFAPGAALVNWRVHSWDVVARNIQQSASASDPIIILNHARDTHGGFRPFDPARHISITGEDLDGWKLPANAMEVINSGATQTDPMQLYRDWFGLLNGGYKLTPVGASDSHDVSRYIVGQGRTYVRCDSADPASIDVAQAVRNFHDGHVLVSCGLVCDMTVNGKYRSGDLVEANGDVDVRLRVLGPAWTRASKVTLFANGVAIREDNLATIEDKSKSSGVKWEVMWKLPRFRQDVFLVAIAVGPGIDQPYWPTAKPYQPTSENWKSYVLGSSGPVWINTDGSGKFRSAHDYASKAVETANADPAATIAALADMDVATAAQAAEILRTRHSQNFEQRISEAMKGATPAVRQGIEAYVAEWRASQAAPQNNN